MTFDVTRCGWMKDTMVAFTYIQDSFTRTTNVSRTQLTQQLELGCSANSANYHSNKIYFSSNKRDEEDIGDLVDACCTL